MPRARFLFGFVFWVSLPLDIPGFAQTQPGALGGLIRCEAPFFAGAMSPQGATATMRIVSDGRSCGVMNWGRPDSGRTRRPRVP